MTGSEKQIAFAKSIIATFNEIVDADKCKQKSRIEKIVSKGKNPTDFISKRAESNYWKNLIINIVNESDDAAMIIQCEYEILRTAKKLGSKFSWGNIAFLIAGMSRNDINSDKYNFNGAE